MPVPPNQRSRSIFPSTQDRRFRLGAANAPPPTTAALSRDNAAVFTEDWGPRGGNTPGWLPEESLLSFHY
eukprot:2894431-Pyramimonas_sp.AAC.1